MNNEFKKDRILFKEKDPRKNASGCSDLTAYNAIQNIDEEEEEFKKLLRTLRYICNVAVSSLTDGFVFVTKRVGGFTNDAKIFC